MPRLQQVGPHGVVPGPQQHDVAGFEHAPLQQVFPHCVSPAGQAASARNGLMRVAAVAPATAMPIALSTPRRDVGRAT
jgi:hypothetical protein